MIWTDESVAFLRAHYGFDMSASDLAERFGVTRSTIIGKASRLGLSAPARVKIPREPAPKLDKPAKPKDVTSNVKIGWGRNSVPKPDPSETNPALRAALSAPLTTADPATAVRYFDRTNWQCPAILNDAPITERLVCGAPKAIGDNWCAHHERDFCPGVTSAKQMMRRTARDLRAA